jgi:DnaJ-class molecular chaperone
VRVQVKIPNKLSARQRELLEEFAHEEAGRDSKAKKDSGKKSPSLKKVGIRP